MGRRWFRSGVVVFVDFGISLGMVLSCEERFIFGGLLVVVVLDVVVIL